MINIDREDCPDILNPTPPPHPLKYGNEVVRQALHRMQHGKCCYCEMKIPDSGGLEHIDHFKPRSKYRELTNEWTNLLLACPGCNQKKSELFPVEEDDSPLLIDPSDPADNPEEHFEYSVSIDDESHEQGQIREIDNDLKGRETINTIRLDLPHYRKLRKGILIDVMPSICNYKLLDDDDPRKEPALQNIIAYADAKSSHAGIVRFLAREHGIPIE